MQALRKMLQTFAMNKNKLLKEERFKVKNRYQLQ